MSHLDIALKLIELIFVVAVLLNFGFASILQHLQVTEDGLAPDTTLVNRSGVLRLRRFLIGDGEILLIKLLEELFRRRVFVEVVQLTEVNVSRLIHQLSVITDEILEAEGLGRRVLSTVLSRHHFTWLWARSCLTCLSALVSC